MMDLEVLKWSGRPETFLGRLLQQPVKPHLSVTPKTAQLMGATLNNLDDMIRGYLSQNAKGQALFARGGGGGDPTHGAMPMVRRHVISVSHQKDSTRVAEHVTWASPLETFREGKGRHVKSRRRVEQYYTLKEDLALHN